MPPPGMPEKDPMSGRLGHLDPGQSHVLKKFKSELEADGLYKRDDIHGGGLEGATHDDATLLRFLRARKFDLAKSKLMFSDSEKWRKEFKVDELYSTFSYPEKKDVDAIYPQFYHKTDKDGRPIYIERLGNLDLEKLYKVTTPERQLQRLVVEYEKFLRDRLPVCSMERGELIDTSCTIMDLSNVGLGQFWKVKNYVQQASHLSQNYYPETMGKFYIVNAPYLFSTVWSWVKPWLDEVTVKKIAILGYDFKSQLLDQIPADSLPSSLGGDCDCEGGCSMSDEGPWKRKELIRKTRAVRSSTLTRTVSGGPEAELAKEDADKEKAGAGAAKKEEAPASAASGAEKKAEVNGAPAPTQTQSAEAPATATA